MPRAAAAPVTRAMRAAIWLCLSGLAYDAPPQPTLHPGSVFPEMIELRITSLLALLQDAHLAAGARRVPSPVC